MQDLPNGGGAPLQALAPGRWRPSLHHCRESDPFCFCRSSAVGRVTLSVSVGLQP